ncbi:MAG: TrmB family transcriptional regulator [Candidatus Odinarchaeota archaeon]|nr:TrmB family transcriptional regulator [Candidatus Odinarchaeota archaeon]
MSSEKNLIEQLMKLGLTQYEAQVFITLVTHGEGTAAQISQFSKVPRPKVYETLESLAQKGLITSIDGTPTIYSPVNLDTALNVLEAKYVDTINSIRKAITNLRLQQTQTVQQATYFVRNEDALMQVLIEYLRSAQRDVIILDPFGQFLHNKQFKAILHEKNKQGIITKILSRRDFIDQSFSNLAAEFFFIDTVQDLPNDSYILIDRDKFIIKFYRPFVSELSYVGAYGNQRAFLISFDLMIQSIERESKSLAISTREINPLDYIKILKSETPLFVDKINYLEPAPIRYDLPYQPFVIVTEDRILLTSILGKDVQVFAIPRHVIYGVDIVSVPGFGNVVRLQYTRRGQVEFLFIGNFKPDELVRALVYSKPL